MENKEFGVEDKADLKRLTAQMLRFASQSRPDLCYEACAMSKILVKKQKV